MTRPGESARRWSVWAFELAHRSGAGAAGGEVPSRRVVVRAPSREAAAAGAGAHRDELLRDVEPRLWERLVCGRSVSESERADFFRVFGSALSAGRPTLHALATGARQAGGARLRGVVGAVAVDVSRGVELHKAMEPHAEVFSAPVVALAAAASQAGLEQSGRLYLGLAARLQRDAKLGRKVAAALAYPAVLLAMAVASALVLETRALPPMVELFRSMGAQLPPVTEAFYGLSRLFGEHALFALPAMIACGAGGAWAARRVSRLDAVQRRAIFLWGIGPILLGRALGRALGTFIVLRQSGAGNRELFSHAAAASGNAAVADFFRCAYRRVALGAGIEESFMAERHRLGDEGMRLAGHIEVGLDGGDLAALLQDFVEDLEDRADTRASLLPKMLELPMLALCGLIVGTILLAMFLPYPSLLGDIARQMAGGR